MIFNLSAKILKIALFIILYHIKKTQPSLMRYIYNLMVTINPKNNNFRFIMFHQKKERINGF